MHPCLNTDLPRYVKNVFLLFKFFFINIVQNIHVIYLAHSDCPFFISLVYVHVQSSYGKYLSNPPYGMQQLIRVIK